MDLAVVWNRSFSLYSNVAHATREPCLFFFSLHLAERAGDLWTCKTLHVFLLDHKDLGQHVTPTGK